MLPAISGKAVRIYTLTLTWKYIFYFVGLIPWPYLAAVHLEGFADKQNPRMNCSVGKVVYNVLYSTWPLKLKVREGPEK